jgi:hypothetical protein
MASEAGAETGARLSPVSDAPAGSDRESVESWWARLLIDEPPSDQTRALWFGLFEGTNGTSFYVQGYPGFEADDETAEWATDDPSWAPEGRYVELASLRTAESWEVALSTALALLRDLRLWESWPGRLDGVAVGFDDGDAHVLWTNAG